MKPCLDAQGECRRVILRGGDKARILTMSGHGPDPIVVALEREPWVVVLSKEGRFLGTDGEHRLDIKDHDIYCMRKEKEREEAGTS